MRLSSRPALRPSPLWLAVLATPLFIGQAMAAPEVYLHVDGKPVAEALTLDKGTVTLTHRLDKGSHQIRISDAGNSCGTSFGPTEARPLPAAVISGLTDRAVEGDASVSARSTSDTASGRRPRLRSGRFTTSRCRARSSSGWCS